MELLMDRYIYKHIGAQDLYSLTSEIIKELL